MKLRILSLRDKEIFRRYLDSQNHALSVFSFANIFIWKRLYKVSWAIFCGSLCIFFQDRWGAFLYLPPLGNKPTPELIEQIFAQLDKFNRNRGISRIENIEEQELKDYQQLGLECRIKSEDYLCSRADLAQLSGNKYKSQRAAYNYFLKNYHSEYLPYQPKDKADCLSLYRQWAKARRLCNKDALYQGMLEDSYNSLQVALDDFPKLDLTGRIVKVDGEIKGFSFGYEINSQSFCILYEITDLALKGLAQFIFRRFAQDLDGYKYINIMDDSGLENLKKVKLSYHPLKLIPAYIAKRIP